MRRMIAVGLFAALAAAGVMAADEQSFGRAGWLEGALLGEIYYLPEGTLRLPDLRSQRSVGAIYARSLNVPTRDWKEGFPGVTDRFEWFAIEYTGLIRARHKGRYSLRLVSDDGSRVFIDDRLIVDNDGVHSASSASGGVDLDENEHTIRVQYFQGPRYQVALQLYCTAPNVAERLFPDCDIELATPDGHPWWPWLLALLALIVAGEVLRRRKYKKI